MNRFAKQLLYGSAFLAIVAGLVWLGYRQAVPAPTCTDGLQNGKEEGLDCGVVCGKLCAPTVQPLTSAPVQLITYENGSTDALVRLDNPNALYGATGVAYTLTVTDASGATVARRGGMAYVNASDSRYIVFPLTGASGVPAQAQLNFNPATVVWATLANSQAGAVQLPIRSEQLVPSDTGFRYQAQVTNRSNFDFNQVDVTVLLYDSGGKVVGTGSTTINTVVAGQVRGFTIDWPFAIPTATRAQVFVTTNLFDTTNFLRTHGSLSPSESPQTNF